MCENCGCGITTHEPAHQGGRGDGEYASVDVLRDLLDENNRLAAHNRGHFDAHGVLVINLMSSPGAGKTSLLERTVEALGPHRHIAVIEGDLATENDARRIRDKGVPAVQITTGSACHLDAHMVHHALDALELEGLDLLFIENVGNLVCPASFDLGQHLDVILLSVPEGDDKPQKYPVMFRAADVVLLTKSDLMEVLPEFDPQRVETHLRGLASAAPVLRVSNRAPGGIDAWCAWLEAAQAAHRAGLRERSGTARGRERLDGIDRVGA